MTKRNRGEGTIYYSEARKQWIGQFTKTIAGQKIRKSVYGATKNEVSEKLLDLRIEMKDIDFIKEKGMPLIQIMELIRDKKYNSNKIKDGQYSRITKTIEKIQNSTIGKMNVKDITADDIQDFLNDNKEYSNSTIKKLYEQFNQAFEYAIRNKYIKDNPIHDVIKPKSINFATRCIESGVNAVVLQRLLGHTDISITLNTYTSVFNLFKDNELEKVIELYKNNYLVTKKEDYIKNSPKKNFEPTEKSTSTLIQAESIEKFQNGTEDIYIDEEYDEMEF